MLILELKGLSFTEDGTARKVVDQNKKKVSNSFSPLVIFKLLVASYLHDKETSF